MVQNVLCITSVSLLGVLVKAGSLERNGRRGINPFQLTVAYLARYQTSVGCCWSDLIDFMMTFNAAILIVWHISIIHKIFGVYVLVFLQSYLQGRGIDLK